jgi:hypothetical protein
MRSPIPAQRHRAPVDKRHRARAQQAMGPYMASLRDSTASMSSTLLCMHGGGCRDVKLDRLLGARRRAPVEHKRWCTTGAVAASVFWWHASASARQMAEAGGCAQFVRLCTPALQTRRLLFRPQEAGLLADCGTVSGEQGGPRCAWYSSELAQTPELPRTCHGSTSLNAESSRRSHCHAAPPQRPPARDLTARLAVAM